MRRGIDAGSRDNNAFGQNPVLFFRVSIEILDAAGQPSIVDQDARNHGVIDDVQPAGFERRFDQIVRRIEESSDVAAVSACSAIVAFGVAVVILRQNGAPDGNHTDADAGGGFLHHMLAAAQRRRRKEVAASGQANPDRHRRRKRR